MTLYPSVNTLKHVSTFYVILEIALRVTEPAVIISDKGKGTTDDNRDKNA